MTCIVHYNVLAQYILYNVIYIIHSILYIITLYSIHYTSNKVK